MSLPNAVSEQVTRLLGEYTGTPVCITRTESVSEGWSAGFGTYPWITRCVIEDATGATPDSVIVKVRRPETHLRNGPERLHNEHAALEFMTSIGSTLGPRLLAADHEAGILVMEDLGAGPALEDLLVGNDASGAERGLVRYAGTLGGLHADTAGHAAEYYQLRSGMRPVDSAFDRVSILGIGIEHAWNQLKAIVADRPNLPALDTVGSDVDDLIRILSEPGPYLALSNGDTCPANCRLGDGNLQFIDFEHAAFRHAALDAAALHFPFPACGCWSRLPEDVGQRAQDAYRKEFGRRCPAVLEDASYAQALTAACAAWTIVRMARLPKLENADQPQPMGFSRRGQLLDTIGTTISCSNQSRSLTSLASWLTGISDALRMRWPHITATQPFYPAFRARNIF